MNARREEFLFQSAFITPPNGSGNPCEPATAAILLETHWRWNSWHRRSALGTRLIDPLPVLEITHNNDAAMTNQIRADDL